MTSGGDLGAWRPPYRYQRSECRSMEPMDRWREPPWSQPTPLPAPAPGDRPLACCACCNLLYYALSTASSSASAPCTQGTLLVPDRPADATGAYVPNSIPTASCTSTTHTPLPYHVLVLSLHVETGHQCYFLFFPSSSPAPNCCLFWSLILLLSP